MTTEEIMEKMDLLTPENRIKFELYLEWLANTQGTKPPLRGSQDSAHQG